MAISQTVFYAFVGCLAIGVVLSVIAAVLLGLFRADVYTERRGFVGSRAAVIMGCEAFVGFVVGVWLVLINPDFYGVYREAWWLLLYSLFLPIQAGRMTLVGLKARARARLRVVSHQ